MVYFSRFVTYGILSHIDWGCLTDYKQQLVCTSHVLLYCWRWLANVFAAAEMKHTEVVCSFLSYLMRLNKFKTDLESCKHKKKNILWADIKVISSTWGFFQVWLCSQVYPWSYFPNTLFFYSASIQIVQPQVGQLVWDLESFQF